MPAVPGFGGPDEVGVARYFAEVAWSASPLGVFTIGTSTLGGTDTLGTSPFDETFGGPYDDLSAMLDRIEINRGRDERLDFMGAGTATITVRDAEGLLNARNTLSPLYDLLDVRLHPVRVRMTPLELPHWESLYYGYVRRLVWEPRGRRGIAQLECVDLFYWLERAYPIIAATGATTTGAAIGLILDAIGIMAGPGRALDTGDAIPDFSMDGSISALDKIGELLESERGVFYVTRSGIPTYEGRHRRGLRAIPVATIDSDLKDASPAIDFGQIRNRVRVRRTQNGYVAEAVDQTSVNRIGYSDLPQIETSYLATNAIADQLAAWILGVVKSPRPPMYEVAIDHRTPELVTTMAQTELVDRWRVQAYGAPGDPKAMSDEFHVDRISHAIEFRPRRRHTLATTLSEASGQIPFQIGISTFAAVLENRITNPSFELGLAGWTQTDGGPPSMTPVRDVNPSKSFVGDGYLNLLNSANGQDDYLSADVAGLEPSTDYTFSAYLDARLFVAAALSNRLLYGYDYDDVGGTVQTATLTAPNAGYQRYSITITTSATPGLHTLTLRLYSPQGEMRYDGAQLNRGPLAEYIDGSLEGCSWVGLPHASRSTKVLGGDVFVY